MRPSHFLRLHPRALRFFVVALALLQFVAPTWHICELGGHAAHRAGASHHAAVSNVDESGPLICVCAPRHPKDDPKVARLDGTAPQNHATCLALLLQTMPGQIAASPAIFESRVVAESNFSARHHSNPLIAAPQLFRGRAPPVKC